MNQPTQQQIEHWLAMVTVAMPLVLMAAHFFRRLAKRLHTYALSTPDKSDDMVTARILAFAQWIDVVVEFVATASSGGLNRTPSLERVESEASE